jgi:hypothetical protein
MAISSQNEVALQQRSQGRIAQLSHGPRYPSRKSNLVFRLTFGSRAAERLYLISDKVRRFPAPLAYIFQILGLPSNLPFVKRFPFRDPELEEMEEGEAKK